MLTAAVAAFLASSTLMLGAWADYRYRFSDRVVGLVMGFGAGALISAVSFELVEEALDQGGTAALTGGLVVGALAYFIADRLVDRAGGADRKRASAPSAPTEGSGKVLAIGAALDGIPESLILGVSLIDGRISVAFFVAVVVSNLPEGVASAASFLRAGRPRSTILKLFLFIAVASAAAAVFGFAAFDAFAPGALAVVKAFAAGGLLTMTMDSMAPEAFREAGPLSGLMAVAGFELAFLLSEVA